MSTESQAYVMLGRAILLAAFTFLVAASVALVVTSRK